MMFLVVAKVLLAGMFGVAGIAKLADRAGVRRMIAGFGVPAKAAAPLGWALVAGELGVALALLLGPAASAGAMGALVLLAGFSIAIAVNVARGRTPACHCFGRLHSAPVGWSTVARNGLLATIAGFVAADGRLPVVFAVLGAIALSLWAGPGLGQLWRQRRGATAPGFSLPDAAGRTWTLDRLLAGRRPVLLVFSHPACAACTALLPEVTRWQTVLDRRLTVAVVGAGPREENVIKAREHGLQTLLLDEDRTVAAAYGVTATPSAVLIDGDGTLAAAPARGAGEIMALVEEAAQTAAAPRLARRALLGRAAVGMPVAAVLPFAAAAVGPALGVRRAAAAGAGGGGSVCVQTYALCTAAPCVQSPTDPTIAPCRCIVETGPSFGMKSCDERARVGNTLYSSFSLQNLTSDSTFMTCQQGSPWANCLDVTCTVDPADPTQAICQCVTVPPSQQTSTFLTFGGNCDTSTCTSVIWSAATTDMIEQAVGAYVAAVLPTGDRVFLPARCG